MGEVIRLPVDENGIPKFNRGTLLIVARELAKQVYGRDFALPAYRFMGYYELLGEFDSLKERMIDQALEAA